MATVISSFIVPLLTVTTLASYTSAPPLVSGMAWWGLGRDTACVLWCSEVTWVWFFPREPGHCAGEGQWEDIALPAPTAQWVYLPHRYVARSWIL